MRSYKRTTTAITLDRDGIAQSQTPSGAGDLTLNGVGTSGGVATLSPPRAVAIYSGSDISARVFTVYGTDRKDQPITDTVTGVNNSTVSTNKIFKTVTRIAVDAGTGAAVEAGWTAVSVSAWMFLGQLHTNGAYAVEVSGTVNYDIEKTYRNLIREAVAGDYDATAVDLETNKTAALNGVIEGGVGAIRVVQNSGTGSVTLRFIPAEGK